MPCTEETVMRERGDTQEKRRERERERERGVRSRRPPSAWAVVGRNNHDRDSRRVRGGRPSARPYRGYETAR